MAFFCSSLISRISRFFRFTFCEADFSLASPKVSQSGLLAPRVRSDTFGLSQSEKRITKGEAREARPNPTIEWGLASRGCYPSSNGYKPLRKNGIDSYFLPFIPLTGSFTSRAKRHLQSRQIPSIPILPRPPSFYKTF